MAKGSRSERLIQDPNQIDLEDWLAGHVRKADPKTSRAAAKRANVRKLTTLVVRALRTVGGLTTEEISVAVRQPLQSITPRMRPLEKAGLVLRTEKTRRGRSGRERIVWVAVGE